MTTNDLPCLPPFLTVANLLNRLPALLGALFTLLVPSALSAQMVSYSGAAVNFGSLNVCAAGQTAPASCSQTLTLTFTVTASGTLGTPIVLTLGAPNLDFTLASGSTCTGAVIEGNTCTVNVNFAPRFAGERKGVVEVVDGHADVLANVPVYGTVSGPQINFQPGTESGIGSGRPGPNGLPTMANGLAVDGSGNVYIADWNNLRVLKETLTAGTYTESTIVGGLSNVAGIAVDGSGNVYICEWNGNRVLKETLSAGNYIQSEIGSGFGEPNGVAVDGSGNVYIADSLNGRVLKETLSGGSYTQADVFDCGSGGQSCPASVAVDGSGNLYVTAFNNSQVFKLTPSGGGFTQSMIGSGLVWPGGIAVDGSGNLYIADTLNSRVVKETLSAGRYIQSTVPSSALDWPWGVAVDQWNNVYIADSYHDRVLKEDFFDPPGVVFPTSTALGSSDTTDGARTVSVWSSGTQPLVFTTPTSGNNPEYPSNFPQNTADTSPCAAGLALAPGTSCDVSMNFVPSVAGVNTGSVVLTDNALNGNPAAQSIRLEGSGSSGGGVPTTTMLTSSPNPSFGGAATGNDLVTLTASVSPSLATGTVSFYDGSAILGTATLNGGTAVLPVSTLSTGTHSLNAKYQGDTTHAVSVSNVVEEQVIPLTIPSSEPAPNPISSNLLINPGAENGMSGWTTTNSGSGSAPGPAHSGTQAFDGVANQDAFISQTIGLSTISGITLTEIDSGALTVNYSFWGSNSLPNGYTAITLTFNDGGGNRIGQARSAALTKGGLAWNNNAGSMPIPSGARSIVYTMDFWGGGGDIGVIDDNVLTISRNALTPNLLTNPGAEMFGTGWYASYGVYPAISAASYFGTDGGESSNLAHSGTYIFCGCATPSNYLTQTVNLVNVVSLDDIDAGLLTANYSFWYADKNGNTGSMGRVTLTFRDENGNHIGQGLPPVVYGTVVNHGGVNEVPWIYQTGTFPIPPGTRSINYTMDFNGTSTQNSGAIDDNILTISRQ